MWQLKVQEPTGELQTFTVNESATIGNTDGVTIGVRDPALLNHVIQIEKSDSSTFWISIPPECAPAKIADIEAREACLPTGVRVEIGNTAITLQQQEEVNALPRFPSRTRPWLTQSIVGAELLWHSKKAAASSLAVHLDGETGTGKEVLAQLIHSWSDRAAGPFVPLHCAALPLTLAESELFGHCKGAYTGADHNRLGALLAAHGGTLFLDEVADLPIEIQVKLLRFLENGEVRPLGADRVAHANVRIICATHKPLDEMVRLSKFRQDLYFRLSSICLKIPPLRERPEDIAHLARNFANQLGRDLTPQTVLRLQAHPWPGNVRQLRHAIERASAMSGQLKTLLCEEDFAFLLDTTVPDDLLHQNHAVLSLEEMERLQLVKALRLALGNRVKAAKILGVARSTLFEMIKRHNIQTPKSALVI